MIATLMQHPDWALDVCSSRGSPAPARTASAIDVLPRCADCAVADRMLMTLFEFALAQDFYAQRAAQTAEIATLRSELEVRRAELLERAPTDVMHS
jgi:hypothetical protein